MHKSFAWKSAIRIVYNIYISLFEDLLQRDQLISIHHRNICLLGVQLYKTWKNISNHINNELFEQRNILYNLRSQAAVTTGPTSTVNNGRNSLIYLGPKIWNPTPPDIRNPGDTEEFARKIKCWTPKNCPCKLCLNYIHHPWYVN